MSESTITMKVFAKNDAIANTAISELQKLLHKDFIQFPLDDVNIKFLSEDEVRLKLSCNLFSVLILKHVMELLIYAVF